MSASAASPFLKEGDCWAIARLGRKNITTSINLTDKCRYLSAFISTRPNHWVMPSMTGVIDSWHYGDCVYWDAANQILGLADTRLLIDQCIIRKD